MWFYSYDFPGRCSAGKERVRLDDWLIDDDDDGDDDDDNDGQW